MRVKALVPLACIDVDRLPINPVVLGLIAFMKAGGEVPPVKLQKMFNGRYKLKDGRHRFLAHKLLGRVAILSKYSTKTLTIHSFRG